MNPLGLGYLRIMGNRNDCDMISDSKWSACDDVARAGESLWCSHQVAEPNRLRHTPVTYAVWFTSTRCRYCFTLEEHGRITVFLSRFGSFLRSESKFSKLPVQSSHHYVTYLITLNKLPMLWYIHANDYVQFSALCYIINCLCHVDQNVLHGSLLNSPFPTTFRHFIA